MENSIYDKFDLQLIESLLDNQYKIKKHLRQYKKDGMMIDDFLGISDDKESVLTINFDGDLVAIDGKLITRFD